MVTVQAVRLGSVETTEFVELCGDNILERPEQPGMHQHLGKAMPPQVPRQFLLMFGQSRRTPARRKWRREVEVQTGIDSFLAGHGCGSLRVRHEDHGTDGRHGASPHATENRLGRRLVASPVVSVHDEKT